MSTHLKRWVSNGSLGFLLAGGILFGVLTNVYYEITSEGRGGRLECQFISIQSH